MSSSIPRTADCAVRRRTGSCSIVIGIPALLLRGGGKDGAESALRDRRLDQRQQRREAGIVLGIGVTLLSRHRLQEKEGRVLKLISGLVMLGLAAYLVFDA